MYKCKTYPHIDVNDTVGGCGCSVASTHTTLAATLRLFCCIVW